MKDKDLRVKLQRMSILDENESWSYGVSAVMESGLSRHVLDKYDRNCDKVTDLSNKLAALIELLGVAEEAPEENTVLKKGNKKVVVGKLL